jgi:hypothetical protein
MQLPRAPGARVEHGIHVRNREPLRLVFESVNSDWLQGVHLETDRSITVDDRRYRHRATIFHNPDHLELLIIPETKEGVLWVMNVWDYRPGDTYNNPSIVVLHEMFCGMLIEELPRGYRYRCNEGRDDDDYDDLIFRIERVETVNAANQANRA